MLTETWIVYVTRDVDSESKSHLPMLIQRLMAKMAMETPLALRSSDLTTAGGLKGRPELLMADYATVSGSVCTLIDNQQHLATGVGGCARD
eukprot:m.94078 g.94078  ORF g.94078 m.94078 type:complete len:91 (+) comp13015_c1_seq3:142-414(+)